MAIVGLTGAAITLWLGMMWAPSVSIAAFKAPEAQRIFYWHVPSAWAAMIAFGMLFVGSLIWFFKRKEWAWRLHVASSEIGGIRTERGKGHSTKASYLEPVLTTEQYARSRPSSTGT